MTQLRYMPTALRALEGIASYTLERWGQAQLEEYMAGIFSRCESLPQAARQSIPHEFGVEGFVLPYRHHRIYWRIAKNSDIIVVAILHERMLQAARLVDAFAALDQE